MAVPHALAKIPKPARVLLALAALAGVAALVLKATGVLGAPASGEIRASGTVEARVIEVSSEVAGVVTKRPVEKGQQVRKGDLIAEVASETSAANLVQAEAAAKAARDKLAQAEEGVRLQEAVSGGDLERARTALGTASARARDVEAGSRPQEISGARAAARQANAALEAAKAQLRQLEAGLRPEEKRQAEASYEGATADVAAARARLDELEAGSRSQEIKQAQAAVDQAQTALTKARKDHDRTRSLVDEGAMSTQQLEGATANFEAAEAALRAARERLSLVKEGPRVEQIRAAKETLNKALAGQRAAKEALALARKGPRQEELDRARAAVSQARANYDAAESHVDLVIAGARSGQKQVARSQTDEARAALDLARGNQRQILVRKAEAEAARAVVAQADAAVAAAQVGLDKFTILAPVPGLIDDTHIRVGEMAKPGSSLVTLVDFSDTWVKVYVPEPLLTKLQVGSPATVTVDGLQGQTFTGTIRRIASQAEFTPKYVQTQDERARLVFAVEIAVPNGEGVLKPGMPADAVFGTEGG